MSPKKAPPPAPVSQDEIELFIILQQVVRQRLDLYQSRYTDLLNRLRAGAAVEKGAHTLKLAPGRLHLLIDGKSHREFLRGSRV